ncbi:Protein of unknown function [Paenibacillus sp. BC26]|nr:Protein of unknown function [Paenibacillus sp. BC26]
MLMLHQHTTAQSCAELLEQFEQQPKGIQPGVRLQFVGVGPRDVYNISAPFLDKGEPIIAGRVESRETELSEVVFFHQRGDSWVPHPSHAPYRLQDPFFTHIKGELIFGGVKLVMDPADPDKIISWVTEFYRGQDIASLALFLTGPDHMKDVRLIELANGEIGVLTRPQGEKGGRGKIGFFKCAELEDITAERIADAPVFQDQFLELEWGGANEPHLLSNGLVGVLGHIASFEGEDRHYQAMTFAIHPETFEKTPMKIIARRSIFPEGAAKRPDLTDVIFSGGIVRKPNGLADLYVGASDAEAYRIEIGDPFLEYEQL